MIKHDVFISYSSKDKTAANAICHILEDNGIKCWIAPRDIPAGSDYGDLIDKAIKSSEVVVVVFSQPASESQWVKGELNIAFEEQKIIIPYRIDKTPLKGQNRVILNHKHWIDAYPDYQTKFNDLVSAVKSAIGLESYENKIEKKNNRTTPKNKWWYFFSMIVLIGAIVTLAIVFGVKNKNSLYTYNKNGIHISGIPDLTADQQDVLTEILDNMIIIDKGDFTMGNNYNYSDYLTELDSLSINPHVVSVPLFYISKYELTQKQWKAFSNLVGNYIELGDEKAVDNISWEEAKAFVDNLCDITGLQFSLPTEAQWEYAAGGGNIQDRPIFSGFNKGINHYAWTISDNLTSSADVGKKLPNNIGLYDMTGNVSEWCLDDFSLYSGDQQSQSVQSSNKKVFRGGDFKTPNMADMKITSRYYAPAFAKREATGLRLVINQKEL